MSAEISSVAVSSHAASGLASRSEFTGSNLFSNLATAIPSLGSLPSESVSEHSIVHTTRSPQSTETPDDSDPFVPDNAPLPFNPWHHQNTSAPWNNTNPWNGTWPWNGTYPHGNGTWNGTWPIGSWNGSWPQNPRNSSWNGTWFWNTTWPHDNNTQSWNGTWTWNGTLPHHNGTFVLNGTWTWNGTWSWNGTWPDSNVTWTWNGTWPHHNGSRWNSSSHNGTGGGNWHHRNRTHKTSSLEDPITTIDFSSEVIPSFTEAPRETSPEGPTASQSADSGLFGFGDDIDA